MAKTKNKKRPLAEAAAQKRLNDKKKPSTNPFEIHINKKKQEILGRKLKADRGLPGVARSKALAKRKHTLLHEFGQKDKDNVFMDKRIGERNSGMTPEEKAMARFAAEKMRAHKKDIYTLNDEEVLTHKGQTLEQIEKFEDPKSDDDDSDNEDGRLGKKFVAEAHFGGGMFTKADAPTYKESLAELIAKDKKKKAEQKKLRGETMDLTEELDTKWNDLRPLMTSLRRTENVHSKADDYDVAVNELKFESRATPSDRLKSEEEIMKGEKEKLEKLEQDRLARMKGFTDDDNKSKHKSADDLDDGFEVETIQDEPLAYDEDGRLKEISSKSQIEDQDKSDDENTTQKSSLKSGAADDDSDDDRQSDTSEKSSEGKSDAEGESDAEYSDAADDEEDDLSDLKVAENSSDEEEQIANENDEDSTTTAKAKQSNGIYTQVKNTQVQESESCERSTDITNSDERIKAIREDLQRRKEVMEKAREELPYTYPAPESYEEFEDLLQNKSPEHQSIILERIIKCNHYSLHQDNREKLCKIFEYLLQFLVQSCRVKKPEAISQTFRIIDNLCPHLYDLAQVSAMNTAKCITILMKEKQEEFTKTQKKYPGLDTLIIFKFISLLFPTSDFRHHVVTPALVFMSQILLRCRVKTKTDIAKGLFITTLFLEYTLLSKRFEPSAINFIRGIIFLATEKRLPMMPKIVPPFKRTGDFSSLLLLEESNKDTIIEPIGAHMNAHDLCTGEIDDDFKIRTLLTAINLLGEFKIQLEELEAAHSIFEPIINLLRINSWKKYPKNIRKHIKQLCSGLNSLKDKKLNYLVRSQRKPKVLKLYEPKIERVFDGKKHRPMSKEKAEQEKLKHKLKKETKGAIREIRRDTSFLAKVHIKRQIQNDQERKRKVKEIFGDAATQQGELNKIKRKK